MSKTAGRIISILLVFLLIFSNSGCSIEKVINDNMENKTIISIFSTTCITPKLMFGQEPRVIMLYKLLGRDYSFFGEGMIEFVEKVKNSYVDKSKFFIPESWVEFDKYCERYLGEKV